MTTTTTETAKEVLRGYGRANEAAHPRAGDQRQGSPG